MAQYNGKTIENLTPIQAGLKGYLLPSDAHLSQQWIEENLAVRHSDTIVYVNGVYRGVAKSNTPLHAIVCKFKL